MVDLEQLKALAERGPEDRARYLDALEEMYGHELQAGTATGRQLLAELVKTHGGRSRTPLAKEFFERLLPLLPKDDQELFLNEMFQDMKRTTYRHMDDNQSWWKRLW